MFTLSDFKSHAGLNLYWKIECDSLTDEDWKCLAYMANEKLPNFGSVEGFPRGGLKFAQCMKKYITTGPLLIVDDVFTTGNSMLDHRNDRKAIGLVAFSRNDPFNWIYSVCKIS